MELGTYVLLKILLGAYLHFQAPKYFWKIGPLSSWKLFNSYTGPCQRVDFTAVFLFLLELLGADMSHNKRFKLHWIRAAAQADGSLTQLTPPFFELPQAVWHNTPLSWGWCLGFVEQRCYKNLTLLLFLSACVVSCENNKVRKYLFPAVS